MAGEKYIKRINGINAAINVQIRWRRPLGELGFAGKQRFRILQRERVEVHLMAFSLKLTRQTLAEGRDAASIRIGRSDNCNFHGGY